MFLSRHMRVFRFAAVREETKHTHQAGPNNVSLLWQWFSVLLRDIDIHFGTLLISLLNRFLCHSAQFPLSHTTAYNAAFTFLWWITFLLWTKLFASCSSNCWFFHIKENTFMMVWCSTLHRKRCRSNWRRTGLDGQPFSLASQSVISSQCVTACLQYLSVSFLPVYICIDFVLVSAFQSYFYFKY